MTLSTLLFVGEPIFLIDQHLSLIDPSSKRIFADNKIKNAIRIGNESNAVLEIELDNKTKILIKPSFQIQITECNTYRFATAHQYGILTNKNLGIANENDQDNQETNSNNNSNKIMFEIKISPHLMTNLLSPSANQQIQQQHHQQQQQQQVQLQQQQSINDSKKDIKQLEKNSDKISSSISIIDLKSEQLQQQIQINGRDNTTINNLFEYFIKPGTYELVKGRMSGVLNNIEIESKQKYYSIDIDYTNGRVYIKSMNSFLGLNSTSMDLEEFNNTYEVVIFNTHSIPQSLITKENCNDFIKIESRSNRREKTWKLINDRKELFKKELTISKDNIELFEFVITEFCTKSREINLDFINKKNPYLLEPLVEISKLYEQIHLNKSPKEILHQILYESHYQLLLGKRLHDPLTHLAKKMDIFNTTILHIDSILKDSKETVMVFGNFESCKRKVISFLKDNNLNNSIGNGGSAASNASGVSIISNGGGNGNGNGNGNGISLSSSFSSISSFISNSSSNNCGINHSSGSWSNSLSIQENFSTQGFQILNTPFKKWIIFKCPTFNDIRNDINSSQSIDYIIERSKSIKCLLIVIPFKEFYIDNGNKVIETIEAFKERFPTTFDRTNHPESQQNVQIIVSGIEEVIGTTTNGTNVNGKDGGSITSKNCRLLQRIKQLTDQVTKTKEKLLSNNNNNCISIEYQICSCLKKESLFQQLLEMEKNGQIHYFEQSVFKRIPLLKSIDQSTPFPKNQYKSTMNNPIMQNRLFQSLEIFALTWTNILSKFLHSEQLIYQQEYNNYLIQLEIEKTKAKIVKTTNQLFELRQKEAIYKKNLRELLRIKENASNQSVDIKNDLMKRSHDKCKERIYALQCEVNNCTPGSNNPLECSFVFIQHGNSIAAQYPNLTSSEAIKLYLENEIKRIETDEYEKELEDCIKYETKKLIKRKQEIKTEETTLEELNKKQVDSEKEIQDNLSSIQLIKDKKKSLEFVLLTKNLKNSLLVEKIISGLSCKNLNNSNSNSSNQLNNFNIIINSNSIYNNNINTNNNYNNGNQNNNDNNDNLLLTFNGDTSIDISDSDSVYSMNGNNSIGSSGIRGLSGSYNSINTSFNSSTSSVSLSSTLNSTSPSGTSPSSISSSQINHQNPFSSIHTISKEKNIFKQYLQTHTQYQNFVKEKRLEIQQQRLSKTIN
ncbi:hypothetical protein ACTFIU_004295 [Dictyostelium citrinum]